MRDVSASTMASFVCVALALAACCPARSTAPAPISTTPDASAPDAAPPDPAPSVDAAVSAESATPVITWSADGTTLVVDDRWSVDPATWHWTARVGHRDARTPVITFPDAPGPAAAAGVRDPSGARTVWGEPGRVCLQVTGVAGYRCATVPPVME